MKTDRPITRKEQYLAKAAGVTSGDTPPAVTKEEQYLKKIADNITGLTENPLPKVSSEDEGKVPVVGSDGKWELGEGGGGSSDSFVVFDGDIVFEEYDDDGDILGQTIDPPEIDAISDLKLKRIAKCPLLYDYAEIDGIKLTHNTQANVLSDNDYDESFARIAKYDDSYPGGDPHVYLQFVADSPGTHRVKIYASYGGAVRVASNAGSGASYLYMDWLDAYVAARLLNKIIIATTSTLSATGSPAVYAPVSYYVHEAADINEDDFYFVSVAGTPYWSHGNRFFYTDWHYDTLSVNMYLLHHSEEGWIATFKPDEFMAAYMSGLFVNVFYHIFDNDNGTETCMHMNYSLGIEDDVWLIKLYGIDHEGNFVVINGLTTNSVYEQSNVWFTGDPTPPK